MNYVNIYKVDLNQGTAPVVQLRQIYYGDVYANRIGADVYMNGEAVSLSGTCSGTAILSDGSTVALTGVISGNRAYVDLPSACYTVEGQIQVYVKLTDDGVTATLVSAVGTVRLTETGTVIDPGTVIDSVSELISDIETAVASIPPDYSDLVASIDETNEHNSNRFNKIEDQVFTYEDVTLGWVAGGISNTGGTTTNDKRVRNNLFIGIIPGRTMKIASDSTAYKFKIVYYSSNNIGSFVKVDQAFTTTEQVISNDTNANYYIRIVAGYTNDAVIGEVSDVSSHISMAKELGNPLKGKKMSLLGDSISAYTGTIPSGNAAYYTGSNAGVSSADQMWWKILCDKTGMVPLVINGWSGSAITQLEDSAHVNKVPMSSDTRCAALNDGTTNPDVILIAGGVNDYTYAESAQSEPLPWDGKTAPVLDNSFTEAYACMIKKLQTNYPKAIVVALSSWFTMRGTDNGYTLTHTVGSHVYTQQDYNDKIRYVAEQMHIPYIDVSNLGINRNNMYPTYAQDSSTIPTHPNAAGQYLMGCAIAEKIKPLVAGFFA